MNFYLNLHEIPLMDTSLDNLEKLQELDKGGMLKALREFPESCRLAVEIAEGTSLCDLIDRSYKTVVFGGMGGSAIGGQLIQDWLFGVSPVPIVVSRGYHLPRFVNNETLVFAVSYSGNTEETLSAFHEAMERGSPLISVTSGGLLEDISRKEGVPLISMPGGLRPRAALPYQFFIIATTLNRLGLISDSWGELEETFEILEELRDELVPEVPTESNPAKRLALNLSYKVPFVYGPRLFEGVAYRLRTQLNENSKVPAGSGAFPELFHNAVLGCEGPDEVLDPLCILIIRDPEETDEMTCKIDRFKALLEARVGRMLEIEAEGRGRLARMFSVIYIGDYVSTYLGLLYGLDPSSMNAIEELKRR